MNIANISMRDRVSEAPKELYGFIYDIPKDSQLSNIDLVQIFKDFHIDCQVQIKRDEKRPFYSARVKFQNSVHLRVATEKMRYFKLTKANGQGRLSRFLPFVQSLSKIKDQMSSNHQLLNQAVNPEISQNSMVNMAYD